MCGAITDGVYVTEHRPVASSVQFPPPLNAPLSVAKCTVPAAVVAPLPAVSVTVAVQVAVPLTGTDVGVQLMLVVVDRTIAVMLALPLLVVCVASPANADAIVCAPIADGV